MLLLCFPNSAHVEPNDGDTPYRIHLLRDEDGRRDTIRCSRTELVRLIVELKNAGKVTDEELSQ